jgi:tetratricopeptide (TPR) repeat protein
MADDDLLQSWKEIAAYLGRSERTCRRWETEFRLPIHRMDGSVRGSVFAYKSELDRWTDEILHEEKEPSSVTSRLRPAKNLIIISALAAIFVVAVTVVLLRIGRSKPARASTSANPTLAILPFTNNTGDESLDFWRNALADLLVSDLSQSRHLNVLSRDRVFLVLRDLGQLDAKNDDAIDLTEVAARTKVESIVVGNFIKTGQRFRISATVRHIPTGDSVVLPTVEARNENEILVRIDELSTSIKNHLVRPVDRNGRDFDLDIGTITTSSLEAYRHFSEGMSSWYEGRAIDAVGSFEKAVAIDPEFATAYDWLTVAYFSLPGYEDKVEESMTRAFELSHHVSPRERFVIHGRYYLSRGRRSWDKALETFEEFARAYPDDYDAARRLANIYLRLEEWEKCIEACENISNPQGFSSHVSALRQAHCALGQYEAALEVAKTTASGNDSFHYRHQLALNLIYQRSFQAALLEADAMLESTPGNASALKVKGDVHFLRAEWDQAEDCYRELLDPVASEQNRLRLRLEGVRRMAQLYRAKGQFGRVVDVLTQAIDEVTALGEWTWLVYLHYPKAEILLAQGDLSAANAEIEITLAAAERMNHVSGLIGCLHLRGMILLEQGDLRGAQRAADQMKTEIEGWVRPKLMGTWYRLAGHIDLARNDVGQAVERFEQAVSLLPYQHDPDGDGHAFYYSPLAFAHYLAGDMAKAQEWYENILALTTGRLDDGEFYAKSHFMLGKIHEQQGSTAEAVRYYRTFLDLWREADSTAPDIEEAKRALADLLG